MLTAAIIEAILFYLFGGVLILSGWAVIRARNPVHSVLYLILAFFNSAALFLLLGAEFLAMIQIIVYVGAVAVLFLFVVMMLNINFTELKEGLIRYWMIGAVVGLALLGELVIVLATRQFSPESWNRAIERPAPEGVTNTEAMGALLYTDYIYIFQAAGMVLLVAMIGAIVLTHRTREGVKKQKIASQIRRTAKDAVEVKKVKPGSGI